MVRNAMFRRIELASRDEFVALAALDEGAMDEAAWDEALGAYYADHDTIATDAEARGPHLLSISPVPGARRWEARQTVHDPEGDHDWVVEAVVDLDASDEAGEPVVETTAFRRL
jgi:hypothetical protein